MRRLGESSRLFTIKDGNKYWLKKKYLSHARALRLAGRLSWGSILDLDSAVELAKVSPLKVTTRSSRDIQHRRVSHENRHHGMRYRRQYISVLNHDSRVAKIKSESSVGVEMVCAVSPGTLQSYLYKYFFLHSVPPVPSVVRIMDMSRTFADSFDSRILHR